MKIKYYEDSDLLSLRVSEDQYKYAKQFNDLIVHYSENNEPVLIEILNASKFLKETTKILPKRVQQEILPEKFTVPVSHKVK